MTYSVHPPHLTPVSRSIPAASALTLAMVMAACGEMNDDEGAGIEAATETAGEPLIGGISTFLRPEVGRLNNCTATLVDRRYVISAAHCFNYTTGPINNSFTMWNTSGNVIETIPIDWAYSLGTSLGATDVAFARLTRDAPAAVPSAGVSRYAPSNGSLVTVFGYGCQARPSGPWGWKQYIQYSNGTTRVSCPGDSGGPRVYGSVSGRGWVWGVNSGYWTGSGNDINGFTSTVKAAETLTGLRGMGGTTVSNNAVSSMPAWSATSGARVVAGDFNGDGRGDVAALGVNGWASIPVAFGTGSGSFNITNYANSTFAAWAAQARHIVAGDFDGDGDTDIALMGANGWGSVPVAFSNRNGTFRITNFGVVHVPRWTAMSGVKVVAGDFDGDGDDDLAFNGASGWNSLPVAFSNRNGSFNVTNYGIANFPAWSATSGAQMVAGDFDGDGDDDIALSGPSGWGSIPVAFSNRNGTFSVTNRGVSEFPAWAARMGARLVAGDFNGDGRDDLAAAGGWGWLTVAFALSSGSGYFSAANLPLPSFPGWAQSARHVLATRVNTDATDDLLLLGGSGWNSVPVAFLRR